MSDNSTVTDEEEEQIPSRIELSDLPDDARTLAKRYAEQEKGSLTEKTRHTLATFVKDPEEGLKMMDELDAKVVGRIVKDSGLSSREELVQKLKGKDGTSKEEIRAIIESMNQENSIKESKSSIENKISQLPEGLREMAQTEFAELVDGRKLGKEQLEKMADKAINLAKINSGSIEKYARLNLGSQSISGMSQPPGKNENSLIAGSKDTFWKL